MAGGAPCAGGATAYAVGVISFLGSGIGRGHAFYLDGVERALRAAGHGRLVARRADVFAVSHGLSLLGWKSARAAYHAAGGGGWVALAYGLLRRESDYNRRSPVLAILGRDLRRWAGESGPLVVDHPAVVGALGRREEVWYVHGEMVAPPEAIVRGAARILVPLPETAEAFVRAGIPGARVLVTGICVENELVPGAEEGIAARRARLAGDGPLTVAFFSSGSEPITHVATLATGACALARGGRHRAIVFARRGGRLAAAVRHESAAEGPAPRLVEFVGREDLDRRTAAVFRDVDLVASPPHERSNWAVALGVPLLLVGPDLGPFAPRNRALLYARGVAVDMGSRTRALALPARVDHLRGDGTWAAMSARGTGPEFRGFEAAARFLATEVGTSPSGDAS